MSKKYPIYYRPQTGKALKYLKLNYIGLEYRIDGLANELKKLENFKNKSDEYIVSYIISNYAVKDAITEKENIRNRVYDPNDPRDDKWKDYTYDEIIEMHKNGIIVPQDVLDWAYSQAATDTDTDNTEDSNDIESITPDELNSDASTDSTYKQDKDKLKQYNKKAQLQEELLNKSEEELLKNTNEIEFKKSELENEQQETQNKIQKYKNEQHILEEKVKNGETLTADENLKYNQLNEILNKESNKILLDLQNFENDLANLDTEINKVEDIKETNENFEEKLNDSIKRFSAQEKYSSKYINTENLKNYNDEITSMTYSILSGNLSNSSNNISSLLSVVNYNTSKTLLNSSMLNSNSKSLIGDIAKTLQTSSTLSNNIFISQNNEENNTAETNNTSETEISNNDNNLEQDNLASGTTNNNTKQEATILTSETENNTENLLAEAQTPITTNSKNNITTTKNTAKENNTQELSSGISPDKSNTLSDNEEVHVNTDDENIIASEESTTQNESKNTAISDESETIEIVQNTNKENTSNADNIAMANVTAQQNEALPESESEPETNNQNSDKKVQTDSEKITKENETQKKDINKTFEEKDAKPEEKGIITNLDASRRNSSFDGIKTSINLNNTTLEGLQHETSKYNAAGISAERSTTSIGETDFVINADGSASISGQGGTLNTSNDVNAIDEDLNKLEDRRNDIESVNNSLNDKLISLNSLSFENMNEVTTSSNIPVQPTSSNNSNALNRITHNISNSSAIKSEAYKEAENAQITGQQVINNSTNELEKNNTKDEIAYSNTDFVSKDINDESDNEVDTITNNEIDSNEVTRISDMTAVGIMQEEIPTNNIVADGLVAEIAQKDMSNAISESMKAISEEIIKEETVQTLANTNAQNSLITGAEEVAKSTILTYGEKVQQKDNNNEIKRKLLTSFEIKRRDEIKRGVEKVSSSARMKH